MYKGSGGESVLQHISHGPFVSAVNFKISMCNDQIIMKLTLLSQSESTKS